VKENEVVVVEVVVDEDVTATMQSKELIAPVVSPT
jgi:hypothetical protein